jgi:hypothetical protein
LVLDQQQQLHRERYLERERCSSHIRHERADTDCTVGSLTFTLTCSGSGTASSAKSATLNVTAPTAFTVTNLVADTAGTAARTTDAHLVNPWGIAFGPATAIWVANNHDATATQYDGNGKAQPTAIPLVVNLAPSAAGAAFNPTGVVFNASGDFVVSATAPGASHFIFAGEGGMIAGWSPGVDRTHAITAFTAADGGPFLDQATIDQIKSWIASGAPNN